MAFSCGAATVEAQGHFGGAAAPIKCNRWSCETCAPLRQRRLIAQGIAGHPTAFITLTSKRRPGVTREQAARNLLAAFSRVVLHFKREQKKPPEARYIITKRKNVIEYRAKVERIARREDKRHKEVSGYLWVIEATKNGWPHLHVLWRGRYMPQEWLSEEMDRLTNSPIVWIERIEDPKRRAGYVAKYCGKAPHKFGTLKRYAQTRNYQLPQERTWERTIHRSWKWNIRDLPIADIRADWKRWGRDIIELGGDVIGWGALDWDWSKVSRPPTAGPRAYGAREGG